MVTPKEIRRMIREEAKRLGLATKAYVDSAGGTPDPIGTSIDGGGANIAAGSAGFTFVPKEITITSASMLAESVDGGPGSIVIDIWVVGLASHPPAVVNSITAAAKPTISGGLQSKDVTLAGWTVVIPAGSVVWFNVDSSANIKRARLELEVA